MIMGTLGRISEVWSEGRRGKEENKVEGTRIHLDANTIDFAKKYILKEKHCNSNKKAILD